jgi:nitroreductase
MLSFACKQLRNNGQMKLWQWMRYKKAQLVHEFGLLRAFWYDYQRYRTYSHYYPGPSTNPSSLSAMIIREAHGLEKGFTLPNVRLGYGKERISKMLALITRFLELGGDLNDLSICKARSVLGEYIRFHDERRYDLGDRRHAVLNSADMNSSAGGYVEVLREVLEAEACGDLSEAMPSRHSIREYAPEKIPRNVILEAVDIARSTPSVCNRQPWHVYIVEEGELRKQLIDLQDGGKGFAETAAFLAIVTSDLSSFVGWGERNEVFVDGGLFAMSLLLAFHHKKLGACPLNWMVTPDKDRRLREIARIKPSENVIMLVSVGMLPDSIRVAKSARKSVADQVTFL